MDLVMAMLQPLQCEGEGGRKDHGRNIGNLIQTKREY